MEDSGGLPWARLVAQLPVPLAVTDLEGTPIEVNRAFARLIDPLAVATAVQHALAAPARSQAAPDPPAHEGRLPSRTGEQLPCTVVPVEPADQTGLLLVHVSPAPHAIRDPLTGLLLRDVLLERVEQALARHARHGKEVELVMVDLDRFKLVNDVHGHTVGDSVLVEVAHRLLTVVRPEDTVCRWGGDEFVVLLEDAGLDGGTAVCGRISGVLQEPVVTTAGSLSIQGSCGWVRAQPDEEAIEVLHRADLEMYRQKRAHEDGRERDAELRARLGRARARAVELIAQNEVVVNRARRFLVPEQEQQDEG